MKTKFICIVIVVFIFNCNAQNYQSIEEVDASCAQLGFMGDEDAELAVDNILSQLGLFKNFTIQECPDINNAVAKNIDMGSGRKERYILYDNNFFDRIDDKAGNDWAAISILAHEIGHHLNGHALNDEGSSHKWELEADEFSGFVLARMGSSLEDAQSAIKTLQLERATRTHPAKADRLMAIAKGWNRGKGNKIVIPEVKKEEIKQVTENTNENTKEITNNVINDNEIIVPVNTEVEDKKLLAQQILNNHIIAIGGEENIIKIKTIYYKRLYTSKTKMNGNDSESEFNTELTYLSPNKYISGTDINGTTYYSLNLEGKSYSKTNEKDDWKYGSYSEILKNQSSYVYEYSLLINNEDILYLGEEDFNGIACYAIRLPDRNSNIDNESAIINSKIKMTSFYNKSSGLFMGTKSDMHTITDYKENTEYLKDSDVNTKSINIFSDYKKYDGVYFPTKLTMINNSDTFNSTAVMDYVEIIVNPEVNPIDFKVKE